MQSVPLHVLLSIRQNFGLKGPSIASKTCSSVTLPPRLPNLKPPFGPRTDFTNPAFPSL